MLVTVLADETFAAPVARRHAFVEAAEKDATGLLALLTPGEASFGKTSRSRRAISARAFVVAGVVAVAVAGFALASSHSNGTTPSEEPESQQRSEAQTATPTAQIQLPASAVARPSNSTLSPTSEVATPISGPVIPVTPPNPKPGKPGARVQARGGSAEITCDGQLASASQVSPAPGYTVVSAEAGPAPQVRIIFESADHQSEIDATCEQGNVKPKVKERQLQTVEHTLRP